MMNDTEFKIEDFVAAGKAIARLYGRITESQIFAKLYAVLSVLTLIATTLIWSVLGARLQSANSDQLSNAYLFTNSTVFRAASMPNQHSFILKWPIFWLIKQLGYTPNAFIVLTVILCLTTVLSLAFLIYRIEKRNLVFGTIIFGLSSVLLLVPAMPYAGGLLPVNMAMITTRNIEYILYILSLTFVLHNTRQKGRIFWAGVIILGITIASDKLFLTLSLASGLISAVFYGLIKRRRLFIKSMSWLSVSIIATAMAMFALWVINTQVTNIASSNLAGPYQLVTSAHRIIIASVYAVMALFTNFGANPAYDSVNIHEIASTAQSRLFGPGNFSYIVNGLILITAIYAAFHLIRKASSHHNAEEYLSDTERVTTLMLIWTSIAAIGAFIFTDHYYPVDSRYLAITLFAGFLALATMIKNYRTSNRNTVAIGAIIIISVATAIPYCFSTNQVQQLALSTINERNKTISQLLEKHHVNSLLGDYWRVLPVKSISHSSLSVSPLDNCVVERTVLNSTINHVSLDKSFAYLLSFDKGLTNFPQCSLDTVFKQYGRPNSSVAISGTLKNPKELLLFYDLGANKSGPTIIINSSSTVLPISINRSPNRACLRKTIMNIVAHEDDDLLFMNPDTQRDITASNCIRTVYLTAGDAGSNQFYWLSRQKGVQVAYSYMNGTPNDVWIDRIVEISDGKFVTISNPRGNSKISLIFMHLPDGNLFGQGFKNSGFESLQKLLTGKIARIHTVDNQSTYGLSSLGETLTTLMQSYKINELRTLADYTIKNFQDHSDHLMADSIATTAFSSFSQVGNHSATIAHYIGYPIRSMPDNVFDQDLRTKQNTFYLYSESTGAECVSEIQCAKIKTYSSYLKHQYLYPD